MFSWIMFLFGGNDYFLFVLNLVVVMGKSRFQFNIFVLIGVFSVCSVLTCAFFVTQIVHAVRIKL